MTNSPKPVDDLRDEQEKLAQRLHEWYLEATGQLDPKNYNSKAQRAYEQLDEPQKDIDRYIAGQVLTLIKTHTDKEVRGAVESKNWYVVNDDNGQRVTEGFTTAEDAGKARAIIEQHTKSDINYWVQHLSEQEEAE